VKPKRPTEADLLAVIQDGFNSQLPKDREAQVPVSGPTPAAKGEDTPTADPVPFVPMVRITLTIPEDLKYRLKMALLGHRRKCRTKMTQDDYCAKAIGALLDQDEGGMDPRNQVAQLTAFLRECIRDDALAKGWAPKAKALLEGIGSAGP
jgi:hypothetical protein